MSMRIKTYTSPTSDPEVFAHTKSIEHDPQFSFEFSLNAKGEPSFKVKDYGHSGYNVIERVLDMAVQTCKALNMPIKGLELDIDGAPDLQGAIIATYPEENPEV